MSRLEIIHLRSSGEPIESLADRIRESIWSEGDQTEVVTIFRRNGLETDLASASNLYLRWRFSVSSSTRCGRS